MNLIVKIGITGITGFVGQNLASYLADFDIVGVSRESTDRNISYQELSLDVFNKQKVFIHLAGKAHDLKNTSNDDVYFEVNFELTKKLYNQFLLSDAQQFIYISSVKATADVVEDILTEEVIPHPITAYGRSKQMAEAFILANLPINKKVYILRPCMIHGPGNKGNLDILYSIVSKGFPWPLCSFENKRSFCSIDNLCFVIKELLTQQSVPSGVYNVADDDPLSTNELIGLIAQSQNRNPKLLNISRKFIEGVASFGDKLHLPLNTERLQKLTSSYVVSNAKIKAAIGKPLPVSSREGLLKTFISFNS